MGEPGVVAFACAWWHPRRTTWSYTAAALRAGFDSTGSRIVDVEAQGPIWQKAAIAAAHLARPGSAWQYSAIECRRRDRAIARQVAKLRPDAVVGIADADFISPVPTYLYQDMSVSLGVAYARGNGGEHVNLLPASPGRLDRLASSGEERLRRATGVFAMSRWLADDLIDRCGVAPGRVLVTHAGLNSVPTRFRDLTRPVDGRLVFVGVDFHRKGGDAVVEAVGQLREAGHEVRLTVIGPRRWPLPGPPPPGVDFRGSLPSNEVAHLLADHDVFVMPSRFEAYGIAFVEALAAGLPCVARRACAMPELVEDGHTGRLVAEANAEEVADAVLEILGNQRYHETVAEDRPRLLERHDWSAVAGRMVERIGND